MMKSLLKIKKAFDLIIDYNKPPRTSTTDQCSCFSRVLSKIRVANYLSIQKYSINVLYDLLVL